MDYKMEIIKEMFKRYSIDYDKECKVLNVNQPILAEDFIYLKRLIALTNLEIQDIRVFGGYNGKIRDY